MPLTLEAIHKILFMRTDRIGDVLMNLPAIRLLRQTYPKAWITVLVDENLSGLLKDHPDIDEIMGIRPARIQKNIWGFSRTLKKINYDACVISNPDKSLHLLAFLAGMRYRVGHDRKWGFLLNKKIKKDLPIPSHEIEKNLSLAKLVSKKEWDRKIELPVDALAVKNVGEILSARCPADIPLVAVHAGTSNPEKRWPADRFAEICDKIGQESCRVVLIGGEEEKNASAEVVRLCRIKPVDLTGSLKLRELTAFFHNPRVKFLLSVDSGPVHIAWISGKPVVSLYAKNAGSDPARWGPLGTGHQLIHKNIHDITADEVYERICEILQ